MDPKDGGSFDAAPPPVSGLGNFKGVMLCNRPVEDTSSKLHGDGSAPAFKSAVSAAQGEQIGLTPCRNFEPTVKTRGPSAALRRHVQWLKELQGQMREERDQIEEEDRQDEDRKQKMRTFFEKQREGVREMMNAREAELTEPPKQRKAKETGAKKKAPPSKPLWAMTETEKDDFEEGEADDLINFAENLDYDKFVGDLEFRHGLDALRDRAGKLKKEQEAFKDALVRDFNARAEDDEAQSTNEGSPRCLNLEDGVDGSSILGDLKSEYSAGSSRRRSRGAERYNPDGRLDWDNSTSCGDERPQVDRELKDTVDRVLESAHEIRQIHSKESLQRIVARTQKQQQQQPADLLELMRTDDPVPVPVIVASSDTQTRLHKPVDPSMLPYLYRSPAV